MVTNTRDGALTFSTAMPNEGLERALSVSRDEVVNIIAESGLRGRGGGGFPVGAKWRNCAKAHCKQGNGGLKTIICNADEGEPGTFKDRVILSDFADIVFEGMTIAAYGVGSSKGIIYLRGEYRYLINRLKETISRMHSLHRLGDGVLGRLDVSFDINIFVGSGAYICGEETALISSLEGGRGEPRNRPPFPVVRGYRDAPSVVNNVETFAWSACILDRGYEWFRSLGTEISPGLKLFSVSGDCENPGVYEYPFGLSVTELLRTVGGVNAKAVIIGGASGQCVPSWEFEHTICFEDLSTGGSIIVLGENRNMLDVAENILQFFVEESCGQCSPCRLGIPKILEGVRALQQGRCSRAYLEELCLLGETMQITSKCGLGQSAPNAFLSIVRHFENEIMHTIVSPAVSPAV